MTVIIAYLAFWWPFICIVHSIIQSGYHDQTSRTAYSKMQALNFVSAVLSYMGSFWLSHKFNQNDRVNLKYELKYCMLAEQKLFSLKDGKPKGSMSTPNEIVNAYALELHRRIGKFY